MKRDLLVGSVALALAVGYYVMAAAIPSSLLADAIGPQGLPKTYAVALAGLSILLMIRSIGRAPAAPAAPSVAGPEVRVDRQPRQWRVAGLLLIGVVYVIAVPWVGYLLSVAGLIVATTHYQGGVVNRHVVGIALSGAFVLWLLFVVVLGIPQPAGWWPALF